MTYRSRPFPKLTLQAGCTMKIVTLMTLITLITPGFAAAWTDRTCRRMATDAAMFLPETLRMMVLRHWGEISAAMDRQAAQKRQQSDRYYWHAGNGDGRAPTVIAEDACRSRDMMRKQASFPSIFSLYGNVAYSICESMNPLNTSNNDSGELYYYTAFEQYMDDTSPQFAIHFTGYTIIPIDQKSVEAEMKQRLTRMNKLYKPLSTEYGKRLAAGQPLVFDARSIPYGIAMITYSSTVNTIVDFWVSLWKASGGAVENSNLVPSPPAGTPTP